jgi:hypothetical protein
MKQHAKFVLQLHSLPQVFPLVYTKLLAVRWHPGGSS